MKLVRSEGVVCQAKELGIYLLVSMSEIRGVT